jgi:hypothetical protein
MSWVPQQIKVIDFQSWTALLIIIMELGMKTDVRGQKLMMVHAGLAMSQILQKICVISSSKDICFNKDPLPQ